LKRRRVEDDDEDGPYDPKYPGQQVIADGGRVRAKMFLMDNGLPDWMQPRRAQPMMDARSYQRVLDSYRLTDRQAAMHRPHQVSLSDPTVRRARVVCEDARDEWLDRIRDDFRGSAAGPSRGDVISGGGDPDDDGDDDLPPGVDETEFARAQMIQRAENDWKRGAPMFVGASAGPSPGGWADYPRSGGPYNADQVEAMRRKVTNEPMDSGDDPKAAAYQEYIRRIESDYKR
jgi:hypothetical protein